MSLQDINVILYASDLLGHDTRAAFRVAVKHAIAHEAKLVFINVLEPLTPLAERAVSHCFTDAEIEDIRNEGYERVREEIATRINNFFQDEKLEQLENLPTPEICVETGTPSETILRIAKDKQADMIVLGTRVHSQLTQVVMGSTPHQVLFHSECPVLVVPIS